MDEDLRLYNMPIRQDIEVLPADKPIIISLNSAVLISNRGKMNKRYKILGWTIFEKVGVAIINPRGISKLSITSGDK